MAELIDSDSLYWKQVTLSDNTIKSKVLDLDKIGNAYRNAYIGQCYVACYDEGRLPYPCPSVLEEIR